MILQVKLNRSYPQLLPEVTVDLSSGLPEENASFNLMVGHDKGIHWRESSLPQVLPNKSGIQIQKEL